MLTEKEIYGLIKEAIERLEVWNVKSNSGNQIIKLQNGEELIENDALDFISRIRIMHITNIQAYCKVLNLDYETVRRIHDINK